MDWSYVTGYFDGEGTAWMRPHGKGPKKCSLVWTNTHSESLHAMHEFIACGHVRRRNRGGWHKDVYVLAVSKRRDLMRVVDAMIPHSLIKRELLEKMREQLAGMKDASPGCGALTRLGAAGVREMYERGMSTLDIARHAGVTHNAVCSFMRRHGVAVRDKSAQWAVTFSNKSKVARMFSPERNRLVSESKKRQWQDPAYREKAMAAIRAGQAKRIAARKAAL